MYAILSVLNSSLFYWFWHTYGDGFHCGYKDVRAFKLGDFEKSPYLSELQRLGKELMTKLRESAKRKTVISKTTGRIMYDEFNPGACKNIMDMIDHVLAKHYGFTDEELDFIVNYDIKYRMGRNNGGEDEE